MRGNMLNALWDLVRLLSDLKAQGEQIMATVDDIKASLALVQLGLARVEADDTRVLAALADLRGQVMTLQKMVADLQAQPHITQADLDGLASGLSDMNTRLVALAVGEEVAVPPPSPPPAP